MTLILDAPPPELLDIGSVPELFCDVVIAQPFRDIMRLHLCREIPPEGTKAEVTGLVFMPLSGWQRSRAWARRLFLPPGFH